MNGIFRQRYTHRAFLALLRSSGTRTRAKLTDMRWTWRPLRELRRRKEVFG